MWQKSKKEIKRRKLLAIFMMIEREVEESDQTAKRMFVEVFGDRESFLEAALRELAKTDEVEQQMGNVPCE